MLCVYTVQSAVDLGHAWFTCSVKASCKALSVGGEVIRRNFGLGPVSGSCASGFSIFLLGSYLEDLPVSVQD